MKTFMRPTSMAEAMQALLAGGGRGDPSPSERGFDSRNAGASDAPAVPFAGGTDLLLQWRRLNVPLPERIVDIKSIDGLTGITLHGDHLVVGPCTTLAEIAVSATLGRHCPLLAEAAGVVACPQVRNRATIGGNLCNASPAADTALPLVVLDARLEITSPASTTATPSGTPSGGAPSVASRGSIQPTRHVLTTDFFTGPGTTVLRPGELLTSIEIPVDDVDERRTLYTSFRKFGTRPSMEIAVVSVAVALTFCGTSSGSPSAHRQVERARVGFGSVAPTPLRARATEAHLEGRPLDEQTVSAACAAAMAEVRPISDVRASADYRREMAGVLLRRILDDARLDAEPRKA